MDGLTDPLQCVDHQDPAVQAVRPGSPGKRKMQERAMQNRPGGRAAGSAMDAALRILGGRDHSEAEIRQKLAGRGFEEEEIARAVARLLDYGYVDDARFAALVARSHPDLGRRGLAAQMTKRGIQPDIWQPFVDAIDQDEEFQRALLAARRHSSAAKIGSLPRDTWQRRLGSYLGRRGFSAGVCLRVCRVLETDAERDEVSWS